MEHVEVLVRDLELCWTEGYWCKDYGWMLDKRLLLPRLKIDELRISFARILKMSSDYVHTKIGLEGGVQLQIED